MPGDPQAGSTRAAPAQDVDARRETQNAMAVAQWAAGVGGMG
jgi:hypothetical protein